MRYEIQTDIMLCLGIGIDDMFVIVQCWQNVKKVNI